MEWQCFTSCASVKVAKWRHYRCNYEASRPSNRRHSLLSTCESGLQRPGVIWFGGQLPQELLVRIDEWLESVPRVDLPLVVGTSARVVPAAEYISTARAKGAYVAFFDLERDDHLIEAGDWYVPDDVATTLPSFVAEALDVPHSDAIASRDL